MAFNLKSATPDTTFPANGFLFGADSQSATDPSIYSHTAYLNYILGLNNTWSGVQTFTTPVLGAATGTSLALSGNGAASTPVLSGTGTWFTGGSATTTKPYLLLEPSGTTSTGWSLAGTGIGVNAAATFTGNLLDMQLNGSVRVRFDYQTKFRTTIGGLGGNQVLFLSLDNTGFGFAQDAGPSIFGGFFSGGGTGGLYLGHLLAFQVAEAANILALRNSTNAQTFRAYNTYTDASNYERGIFDWNATANTLTIGTQAAGTGTVRNIALVGGNLTIASAVATPAGGSTSARLLFGTTAGFGIYYGSGAPSVSAAKGSVYMRSDGSGAMDRAYVNTDGSTTWTAIATVA